jgi:hypothetical protein
MKKIDRPSRIGNGCVYGTISSLSQLVLLRTLTFIMNDRRRRSVVKADARTKPLYFFSVRVLKKSSHYQLVNRKMEILLLFFVFFVFSSFHSQFNLKFSLKK